METQDANYTITNNAPFVANNVMVWFTPQGIVKSVSAQLVGDIPNDCVRQVRKVFTVAENSPNGPAANRATLNFSRGIPAGNNKCIAMGQQVIVNVTYNGGVPPTLEHVRWVNPGPPVQQFDKKPVVAPVTKPGNNLIIAGCFNNVNGAIGPAVYTRSVIDGAKLTGTVEIFLAQAPSNCQAGTPSGTPLVGKVELAEQDDNFDHDRDGCTDSQELDTVAKVGNDPFNPYDCPTNPSTSASYTGIYSLLATRQAQIRCKAQLPAPQCTGQADGFVVPGLYFNCQAALTDPGPAGGQRNVGARLLCYSDSPGINVNNHVAGEVGDGLGGNPPPSTTMGYAEVHATQTSATAKISAANLLTFPTGVCFDNPHSQLGRVYAVGSINLNANPVSGAIDIYIAQPNAACAGSPVGAPFATGVPVQLARQSGTDSAFDLDRDNCSDAEELANTGSQGGLRDPYNWGDFMSVHTGPVANLQKDAVVSVADISAIVARFGTNDAGGTTKINRNTDPKSGPPATGYHTSYDRGGPIPNGGGGGISRQNPATTGSGAGSITIADISAAVSQFGASCAA